jgi:hypothetical protein
VLEGLLELDRVRRRTHRPRAGIQGYPYDAKRRAPRLTRDVWDGEPLAHRLETQADTLRQRGAAPTQHQRRRWEG